MAGCSAWSDVALLPTDGPGATLTDRRVREGNNVIALEIKLPGEGVGCCGEAFLIAIDPTTEFVVSSNFFVNGAAKQVRLRLTIQS